MPEFDRRSVFLDKTSLAVSIRAPQAEAIPICLSRDCSQGLASAYGLLLTKCCLMSEEVLSKMSPPRHNSKVVALPSYKPSQAFCSTMASSEFPPSPWVGCIRKLYVDNSRGRGTGWPILRPRHSAFDNRLLVMQGWHYHLVRGSPPSPVQEVTTLTVVPDLWLIS